MSEEQGNPNGKKRDLLSLILFVILMLIIFVAVLLLSHTNEPGPGISHLWLVDKDCIKNSVTSYRTDNDGLLPILDGTYTNANCSNCNVINISALLIANGGLLGRAPDSCNLSSTGNDNCGGNASLGCSTYASYIWIVDANGNVFSYCAGAGCTTNNSGYQDVWP